MKSNEASAAILNFDKGNVKLQAVASYIVPEQPMGGTPVPQKKPNEKKETIVINGWNVSTQLTPREGITWIGWMKSGRSGTAFGRRAPNRMC